MNQSSYICLYFLLNYKTLWVKLTPKNKMENKRNLKQKINILTIRSISKKHFYTIKYDS